MIEREDGSLNEVDALVNAFLVKRAAEVDAERGLASVKNALNQGSPARRRSSRRFNRMAVAAGLAAALALAFLGGWHFSPIQASPMQLVQEVKRVHNLPLERCYVVEVERIGSDGSRTPFERIPRQVRVWTRGDRFWVEMYQPGTDSSFVWGRGEDGELWAVLDAHRGVRVASEQVPRMVAMVADALSLNVDTLLDDVLHNCVLVEESQGSDSKFTRVVHARPRAARARFWLEQVTLEIDTEARVLRRLIVDRNRGGVPSAKVTFTLVETRPADDASYQLEGRVEEPVHIYEGINDPLVKLELLNRWLGRRTPPAADDEPAAEAKPEGRRGQSAPADAKAIRFTDVNGTAQTPLAPERKKASLLLFLLPDCPVCNAYAPEIKRICTEYESKGLASFVVHPDADVTAEDAKKHAQDYGLPCPVLLDPRHVLVKWTGATMAPEAAVVGPDGKVLYLGRIDDWYVDYGKRQTQVKQHDLRNALDAILDGKTAPQPTGKPIGCHLPVAKK
jgi:peroxiredoxin